MANNQQNISYDEVMPFLKNYIKGIEGTRVVPITEAVGFILAEDIACSMDVPTFDNSAMDGWAICAQDIKEQPFELKEVGSSFAGHPFHGTVQSGECVRIMTGGKMPAGADTVIMQEQVEAKDGKLIFPAGIKAGQNVRKQAEEFKKDEVCMTAGIKLHAPHISFLATIGISEVTVYRKIRIAYFSTGDELQPIGSPLEEGKIYDSNRYAIGAMIKEAGWEPLDLGVVKDDPQSLKEVIQRAADCADAVITSGGVSVGKADYTRAVMQEVGELVPWKCKIKPGRPLAIGKVENTYFFGLPGNPTAAQVTFYTIVNLALRLLANEVNPKLPVLQAKTNLPIKKRAGHTEMLRAVLSLRDKQPIVCLTGSQKTGAMASMINGNCFIWLEEDVTLVEPGTEVNVIPFFGAIG